MVVQYQEAFVTVSLPVGQENTSRVSVPVPRYMGTHTLARARPYPTPPPFFLLVC